MAVSTARGYAIEEVDLPTASDDFFAELTAFSNTMLKERLPNDPPISVATLTARVRGRPKMLEMREWFVRSASDELIGRGSLARFKADTNQHLREVSIEVLPGRRRRGIGTAVFREIVAAAGAEDGLVLELFTSDRVPSGGAFVRGLGARSVLEMHINELDLAEVDRAMVGEWARLDPPGYRLVWITDEVPEPLMENVIVAYDTMNTAPRGGMAMEDWRTTPEMIREFDRARRSAGKERRLALALHETSGETAGYTELLYDPGLPPIVQQQGTAVIPAHRGRGIGKWIKAAMLERAMRDWPAVRFVRTGNADVNAPMLAINTRLGFKPAFASTIWEIALTDARRHAERR